MFFNDELWCNHEPERYFLSSGVRLKVKYGCGHFVATLEPNSSQWNRSEPVPSREDQSRPKKTISKRRLALRRERRPRLSIERRRRAAVSVGRMISPIIYRRRFGVAYEKKTIPKMQQRQQKKKRKKSNKTGPQFFYDVAPPIIY